VPALNHPVDRFLNPFRRYKKIYGEILEPTFSDERIHLLSLNSTRAFGLHADWSDGFLSERQLAMMVDGFQSKPGRFRVLVLHHPLLAPIGHQRSVVRPLAPLLKAIGEAQVDLVLCGHFHRSQIATAGTLDGWKCVVSQAPTVCSTRLQGEPQGFHEIRIADDRLDIVLHQISGGRFITKTTAGFQRTETGWNSGDFQHTDEVVVTG
jgi:3',5'-cyclic AMP phosphodiesterase CpdA